MDLHPPTSPEIFGDTPPGRIAAIMQRVKTIAVVGASDNPARASYGVTLFLRDRGYDVIPVNPKLAGGMIDDLPIVATLAAIDRPVDMVEVFRKPEDLYGIAEEAIAIGAKVLWGQIGVVNHDAARLAEEAGLKVVMNRCPKIELFRPFWKPKLHLEI